MRLPILLLIALPIALGVSACSQSDQVRAHEDADRARVEARQAAEQAKVESKRALQEAEVGVRKANRELTEDANKAREKAHRALDDNNGH